MGTLDSAGNEKDLCVHQQSWELLLNQTAPHYKISKYHPFLTLTLPLVTFVRSPRDLSLIEAQMSQFPQTLCFSYLQGVAISTALLHLMFLGSSSPSLLEMSREEAEE